MSVPTWTIGKLFQQPVTVSGWVSGVYGPINLSTATSIKAAIQSARRDGTAEIAAVEQLTSVGNVLASGIVIVTFTAAQTATLKGGKAYLDLQYTLPGLDPIASESAEIFIQKVCI